MMALSLWEAGMVLGVTPETVRRWLRKGKIQGFKLPGTLGWRIPLPEIVELGVPSEIAKTLAGMAREESRRRRGGRGGIPPGQRFSKSGARKVLSGLRSKS